jgi:hypothetical protein
MGGHQRWLPQVTISVKVKQRVRIEVAKRKRAKTNCTAEQTEQQAGQVWTWMRETFRVLESEPSVAPED